jgi:exosortase/archaeosortase family protein
MTHPVLINPGILPDHSRPAGRSGWTLRIPSSLLLAAASLPVVSWFVRRLDDGSDEPLGLLVLLLALVLAWRERHSLQTSAKARTAGALAVLTSALSVGFLPPMVRAAVFIIGAGAWLGLHRRAGLMGLLILSLPVVASLQFYAGYPMRVAAAEGSVRLLELAGIVVARKGVNIELGGMAISVDPACSGVRMLWHALVAAMALAAVHRVSWRATVAGGLLAVLLVIPANVLRATWLALEESGRFQASGLSHGNVGLLCFLAVLIPLWLLLSKRAHPASDRCGGVAPRRVDRLILLASAMLAPFMMIHAADQVRPAEPLTAPADFTFNGLTLPLHPQPSSPEERVFAKSFPGTISSHRWGDHQVILRRVTTATRRLHPSRDCLRAGGFETTDSVTVQCSDGSEWSKFSATRDGERLIVHERIVSEQDGACWTDVPAWFWSAMRHPLNGPWRAETVISR